MLTCLNITCMYVILYDLYHVLVKFDSLMVGSARSPFLLPKTCGDLASLSTKWICSSGPEAYIVFKSDDIPPDINKGFNLTLTLVEKSRYDAGNCYHDCEFHFFVTPPRNRGGVIFSLQFVCVSVCVSVCPAPLVNKIPAERMHRIGRGFR